MRKFCLAALVLLLFTLPTYGWGKVQGIAVFSQPATTAGLNSTNKFTRVLASATITVYSPTGQTSTLATLYSNTTGTTKANPFTAGTDGGYFFYTDASNVDIRISGVTGVSAFTISDVPVVSGNGLTTLACGGTDDTALLTAASAAAWNLVIPKGITCASNSQTISTYLEIQKGGLLKPITGQIVTLTGPQNDGVWQKFTNALAGQGTVRFSTAADPVEKGGFRTRAIHPQWWGALGDNTNDDTLALQATIDAAEGFPVDATGTPRWADAAIDLGSGVIYKVTAPIKIIGVVGFSMYGGGQENTIIRGYGGTFGSPIETVLDLDGCFEGTFQNFSVEGDTASNYKFMVYYRRDPSLSGRGSSATKFLHIKAGGTWITAGFQIGGSGYFDNYQEDNTLFTGCSARGQWTTGSNYWQHGWYFGTGQFANNLNHTISSVDAINVKNGVTISQSNVQVYGGEVAGCDVMFYFPGGGVQGYTKVDGIRAESVRKLVEWPATYPVFFAAEFSNIELQLNNLALDPVSGTPDWIHFGGSNLRLSNIRVINQASVTGVATAGSTTTLTKAAAGWTVNAYTGYAIEITSGTGTGQESYVTSNTATVLTFSPAMAIAPDATSNFRLILRPSIRVESNGILQVDGVGVEAARLENAFTLGLQSVVSIRNFSELDVDAVVRTIWANLTLIPNNDRDITPIASFGVAGSLPDVRQSRTVSGIIGLSNFAAPTGRIQRLGVPAAPILQDNTGGGATTYTYYLVAKDSAGNKSLPSAAGTITNCAAVLSEAAYIRIYPPTSANSLPVVSYDILKGTTATSIALDVPVERMRSFRDTGQPTSAYSAPTVDGTGKFTVDGFILQGVGSALTVSGNAIAPTNAIHEVGAGLIKNITVPTGFTSGSISLIPTAAFTYDATGNILGTGTAVIGRTMLATRNASTGKWSMSY